MGKVGRPSKDIDFGEFERLCTIQATEEEISYVLGVTRPTLDSAVKKHYGKGFEKVYAQLQASGKVSIRRAQFYLKNKSPAMAIYLGKVYLGQKEAAEEDGAQTIQIVADVANVTMPKDKEGK